MKDPQVFLHSFETVLPRYEMPQEVLVNWTLKAHAEASPSGVPRPDLLKRFALSEKHIEKRRFECPDVDENWKEHRIYRVSADTPKGVCLLERNQFFSERALEVFQGFYGRGEVPDHLIHVTCTGYVSPSPAQSFFSEKKSHPDITHAYHMGCYAALPAVRMARAFAHTKKKTDIVHTEMCSLHMNPHDHSPEQMVVQTLFADGHVKYSVDQERKGFRVVGIKEKIIPDSIHDMTWVPASHGMSMTLSKNVPQKIKAGLRTFVQELSEECGLKMEDILKKAVFAVHPGGPKIIDAVKEHLELCEEQVCVSRKVLRERGNMSSATLPHVWKEILEEGVEAGTPVVSLAFGPGLTLFGGIFEVS